MSALSHVLSALGTDTQAVRSRFQSLTGNLKRQIRALPNGLYVFNFHRIGNRNDTLFDPNVFSCTQESLRGHIKALGQNFDLIEPADLETTDVLASNTRAALLTFDDGYRDNYTLALPVLRAEGAKAIFFICTGFIDSHELPWWDRVAAMVRSSKSEHVVIEGASIRLRGRPIDAAIRDVLREFKLIHAKSSDKLAMLATQLGATEQPPGERLFMDWSEIGEMKQQGMTIGSHTVSHEKLSHISAEEAARELIESKQILDRRLAQDTYHLAYPVGGYDSFSRDTMR